KDSKLHHQESIYASNPTSSSQARLIRQSTEDQQYRSPQDLIHHRGDYESIARANIRSQQQQHQVYSPTNNRLLLQYPNNNNNNHYQHSDLIQYGTPTFSTSSSCREQQSMTMNFNSITTTPKSPLNGYNNIEPSPRLNIHSPIITRQAPPPPPPPPLLSQFEPNQNSIQYSTMKHTIARPSATPPPPPPPPPPPAPPLPVNMGIPTLATISEIDNLPPPPADFIEQSTPSPPPPPPPIPSNIPPAPPLPNSTIQALVMRPSPISTPSTKKTNSNNNTISLSQRDDVSVTSETSMQDQRPILMRDLHSDLLEEIKKGIQLNNRKREEEKKAAAAAVTTKTSSLNVMAIMEQAAKYRRDKIRPQSESENDDESSRWDDTFDIIWALSFNSIIVKQLQSNQTFTTKLVQINHQTNDENMRKIVNGILWNLNSDREENIILNNNHEKKFDIMISYSHKDKDICKQLYDELIRIGYRVWIDFDQMYGNVMDAMVEAIEQSQIILICMSEQYQRSNYCRAEAQYAFQKQLNMIPILLQKHYKPDGWLAFLIGSLLYIDFTKYEYSKALDMLLKELKMIDIRNKTLTKSIQSKLNHKEL
ncbi:unnamed protein product, partial [Rotaria sordida]